ncbi:hypothetical protein DET54_1212 [Paenibacillus pabuli]|uniref:Uncharacterized protein n=1 Tax=Paenibacillus pabuli TaxID=1472 RepID=A0ABX9BC68_9BACL|nr:hypothetical protein [Paenibacillus pabuli]RAI85647.1 hypothetical protein DET54_1212 [Paenibacillus pabuli]
MNIRSEITFNKVMNREFDFIRNIEVLLEVNFPLIFSFEANERMYLGYVLDFKIRKKILNIMIVETDDETIYGLLDQKISLNRALTRRKPYIIYSDKEEIYQDINKVLPDENFLLTELLPNSVDIIEKKNRIAYLLESKQNYHYDSYIKFERKKSRHSREIYLISESYIDSDMLKNIIVKENKNLKKNEEEKYLNFLKPVAKDEYIIKFEFYS